MDVINQPGEELYPGGPVRHEWKILASLLQKDPRASKKVLADAMGFSYQTILNWIKDPRYQAYENWVLRQIVPPQMTSEELTKRADAQARVFEKFGFHAEEMQERLLTILETTDDVRVQKEIAQDWLDRAGLGAPKTATKAGMSVNISADVLAEFFLRAREAGVLAVPVQGSTADGDLTTEMLPDASHESVL